jgi:hypothetical protein
MGLEPENQPCTWFGFQPELVRTSCSADPEASQSVIPYYGCIMCMISTVVEPGHQGLQNPLQGDFGEAWVEVIAAACGLLHGRPTTLDLEKADVELVRLGVVAGTFNPTVKVQVRTTHDLRDISEEALAYDLDVGTYNVLRRTDHSVRRVLVVIGLSEQAARVRLTDEGILLVGRAAWVSLEGHPPTSNTGTVVVKLPKQNAVDPRGLQRLLELHGVRRSTPVPITDPWREQP